MTHIEADLVRDDVLATVGDQLRTELRAAPGSAPKVLVVGLHEAVSDVVELARGRGLRITYSLDETVSVAIADDDVHDGLCTSTQARLMAACRELRLPCLTVHEARTLFNDLV